MQVADVNGQAICGLTTSCELQLISGAALWYKPPRYPTLQLGTKVIFNCYILIDLMVLANLKENTTLSQTQMYHL